MALSVGRTLGFSRRLRRRSRKPYGTVAFFFSPRSVRNDFFPRFLSFRARRPSHSTRFEHRPDSDTPSLILTSQKNNNLAGAHTAYVYYINTFVFFLPSRSITARLSLTATRPLPSRYHRTDRMKTPSTRTRISRI